MDDPDATPNRRGGSAAGERPVDGRASRPRSAAARRRALRHRRTGALVGFAVAALVVGIVVGAAARRGPHHGPLPRAGAGSLSHTTAAAAHPRRRLTLADRENDALNRTLAYTPYVRMAGTQHREIALTFDDGPGPYTPRILAVLRRTDTPATFFEVGEEVRYFGAATARIVAMGDPIGDHTETHAPMSQLSARAQRGELLQQTAAIGDRGAPFPRMFRPPYGLWDGATLRLLHRYGMLMVLWSVDTDDWQRPGARAIIHRALSGATPGAIILMHDAGGNRSETVAALPTIIHRLRARGYRLVTVPRLLLDNPAPRQQDVASLNGEGG